MDETLTPEERVKQKLAHQAMEAQSDKGIDPTAIDIPQVDLEAILANPEALRRLQEALAITAGRPATKHVAKMSIELRRDPEKGYVVQLGNTYRRTIFDKLIGRDTEVDMMKIKYAGDQMEHEVIHKEYMALEHVRCEVLSTEVQEINKVVGETISRETGRPVQMIITTKKQTFTVKTPEGETLIVPETVANS